MKLGNITVKTWSTTQRGVALSSGEAEYYGMVRGASAGLGLKGLCQDLGVKVGIVLKGDASAAIGIASRRGLGKVRHIEVAQLWLQGKVAEGTVKLMKVGTHENLADALTKAVEGGKLIQHTDAVGIRVEQGRHELMPKGIWEH